MDKELEKLFLTIFSDALVIDIDFSVWDKHISLLAIADHLKSSFSSDRKPVYKIKFLYVKSIQFNFNHHVDYMYQDDNNKHYTWLIDRTRIERSDKEYKVTLMQSGSQPLILVEYQELQISELDPKYLDKITPGWYKPYSPLARRDVESIYENMALQENNFSKT